MESSNRGGRLYRPSCSAPKGKTYLTIGQDFNSVEEYVLSQYNASLHRVAGRGEAREFGKPFQKPSSILSLAHFEPACTMTYTSIQKLEGLDQPAEFGSGIQYALGKWTVISREACYTKTFLTCKSTQANSTHSLCSHTL